MAELSEWDSFYVIVASAAGGLIGLQFVVMTLIAERPPPRAAEGGAAFATPTIVHFGMVLFFSAIIRAPWHAISLLSGIWGLVGLSGVIYSIIVARRMGSQGAYRPQFEDWIFHALLPLVAYATLTITAFFAHLNLREALFGVGAAALLLLLIGIHNAWDAVVYHVLYNASPGNKDRD